VVTEHSSYDLLAEPLKACLWRMGWKSLRPIQDRAIQVILQSQCDLIVAAGTATGKTEAAFLPILSSLVDRPTGSLGVMYVGPLKALINDQFRRLEELCEYAELPVHRWHGDVSAAKKREFMRSPRGVLLITPESLESLFINRTGALDSLFRDLQFVVIDELHAFAGHERGFHLQSLLRRLELRLQREVRTVALSATLGDWSLEYARWIRPADPRRVAVVSDDGRLELRYLIYACDGSGEEAATDTDDQARSSTRLPGGRVVETLFKAFAGKKCLIFANRKRDVECFADALSQRGRASVPPVTFLVHHGSLSKEVREDTEASMRGDVPFTTVCSSTLELGIDIGNVSAVGQIGPPSRVASVVQRLGRSGRRDGETPEMRMFVDAPRLSDKSSLIDQLRPDLLQAIALTELMRERIIERPTIDAYDFSTFVHQVLSVVAETGGIRPSEVHQRLVDRGAFTAVTQTRFGGILEALHSHDLLESDPQGYLILGIEGERVVRSRDFYSAFAAQMEYAVRHEARTIGSLSALLPPQPGEHVILAGRRWRVVEINNACFEIVVEPASGRKPPVFCGDGAEIEIQVRKKMRQVLLSGDSFPYLHLDAEQCLQAARERARHVKLAEEDWHSIAAETTLWFTWTGSRVQRTLVLFFKYANLDATDLGIAIQLPCSVVEGKARLAKVREDPPDALALARMETNRMSRKFDRYLDDESLCESFAHDRLDMTNGIQAVHLGLNHVPPIQH
jgi:ATP-dependent Lhr-like helicase